jgi:crossover junction endodeoxyribonuclease RusA
MTLRFKTLPPSINHLYQRGERSVHLKPEVRTARDAMGWEARAQYRGEPLDGPLAVEVLFFWPDKRKHDIDNGLKFLLDALTDIIWWDDGQISDLHIIRELGSKEPGVEMRVWELS